MWLGKERWKTRNKASRCFLVVLTIAKPLRVGGEAAAITSGQSDKRRALARGNSLKRQFQLAFNGHGAKWYRRRESAHLALVLVD